MSYMYQSSWNMNPSHNTQAEILHRPQLRSQDKHREVVRLRDVRRRLLRGGDRLPHRGPLRPQDGHCDGPGGEPQPGDRHRPDRGGICAGRVLSPFAYLSQASPFTTLSVNYVK